MLLADAGPRRYGLLEAVERLLGADRERPVQWNMSSAHLHGPPVPNETWAGFDDLGPLPQAFFEHGALLCRSAAGSAARLCPHVAHDRLPSCPQAGTATFTAGRRARTVVCVSSSTSARHRPTAALCAHHEHPLPARLPQAADPSVSL